MSNNGQAAPSPSEAGLFRIGEVSRLTRTKAFVLRYWESEFPMLQPVKTPAGHRFYRQQDVEMVLKIKRLLHDEGFTIAGARRLLQEGHGQLPPESPSAGDAQQLLSRKMLLDLRDTLRAFLTLLERR
ncbi:MAG: MerR family transcriptional regulator [Acidobacteriia bacterium]|nr:MerR family transcriptional regulator [Terriglobia bacterium]